MPLLSQLLAKIATLDRGVLATDEDKAEVEKLVQQLERANPNKSTLASPFVNGKWQLLYT